MGETEDKASILNQHPLFKIPLIASSFHAPDELI
jgi:hypothetical protein